MKDFKIFKSLLMLSSSLSCLLVGVAVSTLAGCNHKKAKPKPAPEIKWTPTTKAKSLITETLKHFDQKHPFSYDFKKYFKDTWGDDFDSPEAKELFIKWFFPKIPNDKILFEPTEDLCFAQKRTQKVYADYDFKTWGYTQISFWIKDISK